MTDEGFIDEPTPAPVATEAPAPVEQPAVETPAPEPAKPEIPRWALGRINEETNKRVQVEQELHAARQRAADAEALLARLQQKPDAPSSQPDHRSIAPSDFTYAVQAEAARMRLFEDSLAVRNEGLAKLPNFADTLDVLNKLNVTHDAFVADLVAVDKANAHVILDKLAKDPERATQLARMDPRQRTAELTRMSMAEQTKPAPAKAAAPAVSRAPAPRPAMEALSAPMAEEFSDDVSDAEFSARWDKKYLKRA